jgi:hypothetical protein
MPTKDEIKEFSMMVEDIAKQNKIGFMDAICHHCKETGLEIEVAASLISASLKSKIRDEAYDNNMLKKTSRLPI